ncbi:MAG: polysaccharide deacetylase family protein [Alphaproteobacteria bacterium]|nr:polysaccharide deacetylase family protein [Alphaproteobacteria bacterium]
MRSLLIATMILSGSLTGLASQPAHAAECAYLDTAIGLERVIEIDASTGALFGGLTSQQQEPTFLNDKEVVLSFDDGPSPWVTPKILDTLERHCTKATFFAVGKMAVAYPDVARDILVRGHTLGGHTWSHPRQLPKMKPERAKDEIERGFAALEAATGGGIAPFFRFTGLNDSAPLLNYLQERGIATFTVDVVSDDSFIASPDELARITLQRLDNKGSGILLFHDIKPATAKALQAILDGLKARGYRVVHLRYGKPVVAQSELVAGFAEQVATKLAKSQRRPRLMPFYGAISELSDGRGAAIAAAAPPVTKVAPEARDRTKRPPAVLQSPPKSKKKPAAVPKAAGKGKPAQGPMMPSSSEELPWKSSSYPAHEIDAAGEPAGGYAPGAGASGVGAPDVR